MNSKKKKWWFYGAFGALLFGAGLSIAIESGINKYLQKDWYIWVLGGILGIALSLSGVVLLIKAGILDREIYQGKVNSRRT